MKYRADGRPTVSLDETWYDTHDVVQKNISTCAADYHKDMNSGLIERWFEIQLLPNLQPNSVIVMDNAP